MIARTSRDDENIPWRSILARYFAICLSGYLACLSGEPHRSLVSIDSRNLIET